MRFLPFATVLLFFGLSTFAQAQGYTPIVGIPGMANNDSLSTEGYVQALYKLSITAACLIALVKIVWAGVKWTLSDVVTDKGSAKKDIWGALVGLLIILSAVLVLNTINPNLTKLNIFGNAPSLDDVKAAEESRIVSPGTVLYNDPNNPAVKKLIATCTGEVVSFGSGGGGGRSGGGNSKGSIGCYQKINTINAQPGDTMNDSLYSPKNQDGAYTQFKNTCIQNGGRYGDNLFGIDDECMSAVDTEEPVIDEVAPII